MPFSLGDRMECQALGVSRRSRVPVDDVDEWARQECARADAYARDVYDMMMKGKIKSTPAERAGMRKKLGLADPAEARELEASLNRTLMRFYESSINDTLARVRG